MTASTTATHRVVCGDYTHEASSLPAAQAFLTSVETAGACRRLHTIQVRRDNAWVPVHVALAQDILAAPMAATIDTFDGPMIKAAGSWSKEAAERANAAASSTDDPAVWLAALGPHEDATLTADGRGVRVDAWCQCAIRSAADAWVRYERWTAEGRVGHGYACPKCRLVTQTG